MIVAAETLNTESNLQWLLQDITAAPALPITGIATDSRRLDAGVAFLAVRGLTGHGLDYLEDAQRANVAAVVWDSDTGRPPAADLSVPMLAVPGLKARIGELADRWYGMPSAEITIAGITGTNGKTTVALLIAQSMRLLKRPCGYAGTLGAGVSEIKMGGGLTTPTCVELHGLLAEFRNEQARYAALEISSHAIDQQRIAGVHIDTAVFTNLSRDHMDYHGDMRAYFDSKSALFLEHDVKHRIVNVDSSFGRELAELIGAQTIAVSMERNAGTYSDHIEVTDIDAQNNGSRIAIRSTWGDANLFIPLVGTFNVMNATQALAVLLSWQTPFEQACAAIENCSAPPGRMQQVESDGGASIFVDFAHTPAALEAALKALRPHCRGALWCVFGAGGDRDRGKRPPMGEVVAQLADRVVVTSDNPRHEVPDAIISEIRSAMPGNEIAIVDRLAAIAYAIDRAGSDDLVLIAGRGHEQYQKVGDERIPFSDYEVALANIARGNQSGAIR